jgi:hypothetical protein
MLLARAGEGGRPQTHTNWRAMDIYHIDCGTQDQTIPNHELFWIYFLFALMIGPSTVLAVTGLKDEKLRLCEWVHFKFIPFSQ